MEKLSGSSELKSLAARLWGDCDWVVWKKRKTEGNMADRTLRQLKELPWRKKGQQHKRTKARRGKEGASPFFE